MLVAAHRRLFQTDGAADIEPVKKKVCLQLHSWFWGCTGDIAGNWVQTYAHTNKLTVTALGKLPQVDGDFDDEEEEEFIDDEDEEDNNDVTLSSFKACIVSGW